MKPTEKGQASFSYALPRNEMPGKAEQIAVQILSVMY